MVDIRFEHPLNLPEGWVITPLGQKSNQHSFSQNMTLTEALTYLHEEAQQLDSAVVKVSSNFQNANNERSRKQISQGNGFAVQIKLPTGVAHIACDKWMSAEHNAYAIYLAIKNLRQFEKWGIATTSFMLSPFMSETSKNTAFAATGAEALPDWMLVLGLGPTSSLDDANAIYRARAKLISSDEKALLQLNIAMDIARKKL